MENWLTCAGHLKYLLSKLHKIEEIFDEIQSSEIPNQEILLTNIMETVGDVKRSFEDLLKISTKVLVNTQNQNVYYK